MTDKEKAQELIDRIFSHNITEDAHRLTVEYIGADNLHLLEGLDVDEIIRITAPAAFVAGINFATENMEDLET